MSGTNCGEGDLAEIVRSYSGNEGKRVVVLSAVDAVPPEVDHLIGRGHLWFVQPLQPLICATSIEVTVGGRLVSSVTAIRQELDIAVFPDAWLRPIRDPDPEVDTSEGADLGVLVVESVC